MFPYRWKCIFSHFTEDLPLLTPFYVVLGFMGTGLLIQFLKWAFTKKPTQEEKFHSASFKEYLQVIKEKERGTKEFETAFCNAYASYRTEKEFEELFKVAGRKESYIAVALQQRWAEHGVRGPRRPLPTYIFSS